MREKILLNERYGVVEIDKTGLITGYNRNALSILSGLGKTAASEDLKGMNISEFSAAGNSAHYDPSTPGEIISSFNGIKLIDTIPYNETELVIVRFVKNNEVLTPFFNGIRFSSSLNLELDNDQNIIFASDSFCKIAGMEKSDIFGSHISKFMDKDNTAKIRSAENLCKESAVDCIKIEEVQFTFNGIACIYDMEILSINDNRGLFCGILCHFIDTSFEKKCKTMSRVIRRMSAVANFAGGIAHDYNNALTAVLGNISLAKMDAEKNSELEELLRDAESAGLKIKTLTERLGMFARGMKPVKDKTDMKKLIESIVPELFSCYKGHYRISIPDNMRHPEIDQELISEAFRHVVENAVDAADKPDGEIVIEAEESEINEGLVFRETSLVAGKYIIISVKDNGSGLEQFASSEIFDPYVTTKDGREGLGLALAYTIIKRHRGFISVETPESGGAVFKIFIPLF